MLAIWPSTVCASAWLLQIVSPCALFVLWMCFDLFRFSHTSTKIEWKQQNHGHERHNKRKGKRIENWYWLPLTDKSMFVMIISVLNATHSTSSHPAAHFYFSFLRGLLLFLLVIFLYRSNGRIWWSRFIRAAILFNVSAASTHSFPTLSSFYTCFIHKTDSKYWMGISRVLCNKLIASAANAQNWNSQNHLSARRFWYGQSNCNLRFLSLCYLFFTRL